MKRIVVLAVIAAVALASQPAVSRERRHRANDVQALGWREVATDADRARLRRWRVAFVQGLAASGAAAPVEREGVLLRPDAAQPLPRPPAGDYRCRTLKLGRDVAGGPAFLALPAVPCRIAEAGGMLSLAILDGPQRPVGLLFPDDEQRMVFLGTVMVGDEAKPLAYGRDTERDMIGGLERIGPDRWRLVLPFPHWESTLDLIEIVPRG